MTVPGRPVTFPKKDVQTGFRSTWNPSSSVPGWQSSLFSRPPALALLPLGSRVCFQFLPTLSPLHLCISCSLCQERSSQLYLTDSRLSRQGLNKCHLLQEVQELSPIQTLSDPDRHPPSAFSWVLCPFSAWVAGRGWLPSGRKASKALEVITGGEDRP